MEEIVKTDYKKKKDETELAIYNEWNELISVKGAMKTGVEQYLMDKYGIYSRSTIWRIIKRVERRLNDEQKNG